MARRPRLTFLAALVSVLAACAVPYSEPPTPPPGRVAPEPTPVARPAQSTWKPRPDRAAKARYEELSRECEALIDRFRDAPDADLDAPKYLLNAADCLEEAGRYGQVVRVIRHLSELAPDVYKAEQLGDREVKLLRWIIDDRAMSSTLLARACGATIIDPPPEAKSRELIAVANCLDQDMILMTVSLRYRELAAKRGAGQENAKALEQAHERVQKIRESIERAETASE